MYFDFCHFRQMEKIGQNNLCFRAFEYLQQRPHEVFFIAIEVKAKFKTMIKVPE